MKGNWVLTRHVRKDQLAKALAFLDMMKVPYETNELKSSPGMVSIHGCFEGCDDPAAAQMAWQKFIYGGER